MSNDKRVTTRKQAQTVTTLHAQAPSNLPEKLKNMVEGLEEELEVTGNSNLDNEMLDVLELAQGHSVTTTFSSVGIEGEVEMKKEKEKKYYVMNHKGATMLAKTPSGEIACSNCYDLRNVRDEYLERYQLTEKEIKSVDKRYWAFAEEVTDRSLEDWGKWQYHMGEIARKRK